MGATPTSAPRRRLSRLPSSGSSPIRVAAVTGPTPGTVWTRAAAMALRAAGEDGAELLVELVVGGG